MPQSRRSLNLSDTRSVLATTGDLAIGAYARRARRQRIGIALLGLALIAGAGATYWALREPAGNGNYRVLVRCSTCGHEAGLEVSAGQVFPLACPKCKERACRQVWQCRKCAKHFVPEVGQTPSVCPDPACRSAEVGSAAAP